MVTEMIKLGYEVGSGREVKIPLHHSIITGLTDKSGKTTTIEALLTRMKHPSLIFKTKRGELEFAGNKIPMYFKERTDWEYIQSLMEAALQERLKWERGLIIWVSKGAKTLKDVHNNIKDRMEKAKGMGAKKAWTELDAYMEKVLPQLEKLHFANSVSLKQGMNVMDLLGIDERVQLLIIQSTLEYIYKNMQNVVVALPEMWKTCPQAYKTPVKIVAEHLIREGRSVGIYVYGDAQDVVGVEKKILKSVDVWLLGRQRELNEIKRTLAQIPSMPKPKPDEIALLKKGEFYACFDDQVIKTYVQPAWLEDNLAISVASGEITAEAAVDLHNSKKKIEGRKPGDFHQEMYGTLDLKEIRKMINEEVAEMMKVLPKQPMIAGKSTPVATVEVTENVPLLIVNKNLNKIEVDNSTPRGTCYLLIAEGFFDEAKTVPVVKDELMRRGKGTSPNRIYEYLDEATGQGLLYKTSNPTTYFMVDKAKERITINEVKA